MRAPLKLYTHTFEITERILTFCENYRGSFYKVNYVDDNIDIPTSSFGRIMRAQNPSNAGPLVAECIMYTN